MSVPDALRDTARDLEEEICDLEAQIYALGREAVEVDATVAKLSEWGDKFRRERAGARAGATTDLVRWAELGEIIATQDDILADNRARRREIETTRVSAERQIARTRRSLVLVNEEVATWGRLVVGLFGESHAKSEG